MKFKFILFNNITFWLNMPTNLSFNRNEKKISSLIDKILKSKAFLCQIWPWLWPWFGYMTFTFKLLNNIIYLLNVSGNLLCNRNNRKNHSFLIINSENTLIKVFFYIKYDLYLDHMNFTFKLLSNMVFGLNISENLLFNRKSSNIGH